MGLLSRLDISQIQGHRVQENVWVESPTSQVILDNCNTHGSNPCLPLAAAFSKKALFGHLLALATEDGEVITVDTRKRKRHVEFDQVDLSRRKWSAHQNAIFDIIWLQDDSQVLTASGDQSVCAWDVETTTKVAIMKGHSGSVKTLSAHPSNAGIFSSGARDGKIMTWDMRQSSSVNKSGFIRPTASFNHGLALKARKNKKKIQKSQQQSSTAVMYMNDGNILASAGSLNGVVNFWDLRKPNQPVCQTPEPALNSGDQARAYGVSSLSQDESGTRLAVSCCDSTVYVYSTLEPEKGPSSCLRGHCSNSFFIKAKISPDGKRVVCGSSDNSAYVWQLNSSDAQPTKLRVHEGEVTAVDWCSADTSRIVTCSDDGFVLLWNLHENREPRHHRQLSTIPLTHGTAFSAPCSPSLNSNSLLRHQAFPRRQRISAASRDSHCAAIDGPSKTDASPCSLRRCMDPHAHSLKDSGSSACTQRTIYTMECSMDVEGTNQMSLIAKVDPAEPRSARSPLSVLDVPLYVKNRKTIDDYFS